MANKAVGQPTVMTDDVLRILEQCFLIGCTDEEACNTAGIATTTLYNYQVKHPEYTEQKALLKTSPTYKARKAVVDNLEADPYLALKFLERKKKDEFSLRSELTGADGEKLEVAPTVFVPVGKDYEPPATD